MALQSTHFGVLPRFSARSVVWAAILLASRASSAADAKPAADVRDDASRALAQATEFFRESVSTEGGYLWQYSADLGTRDEAPAGMNTPPSFQVNDITVQRSGSLTSTMRTISLRLPKSKSTAQ